MRLNTDGTGHVSVFSGAVNGEDWAATWEVGSDKVMVTLTGLIRRFGTGSAGYMFAGRTWSGALGAAEDGKTILTWNDGTTWCNLRRYGYSIACGA